MGWATITQLSADGATTVWTDIMIELITILGSLIGGYLLFGKDGEDIFY